MKKIFRSWKVILIALVLVSAIGTVYVIQYSGCQHPTTRGNTCVDEYIGLTLEQATKKAEENNLKVRLLEINGEFQPHIDNLDGNRINFYVNDSVITNADIY